MGIGTKYLVLGTGTFWDDVSSLLHMKIVKWDPLYHYKLVSRSKYCPTLENVCNGPPVDKVIVKLQALSPNRQHQIISLTWLLIGNIGSCYSDKVAILHCAELCDLFSVAVITKEVIQSDPLYLVWGWMKYNQKAFVNLYWSKVAQSAPVHMWELKRTEKGKYLPPYPPQCTHRERRSWGRRGTCHSPARPCYSSSSPSSSPPSSTTSL